MSWRDGEIKVGAGDVGQNVVMNMTDPYGFAQIDILQFVNKYPEYPVEWEFSRDTGMDLSGVLNMMNFTKCVREQIGAEIRGIFSLNSCKENVTLKGFDFLYYQLSW